MAIVADEAERVTNVNRRKTVDRNHAVVLFRGPQFSAYAPRAPSVACDGRWRRDPPLVDGQHCSAGRAARGGVWNSDAEPETECLVRLDLASGRYRPHVGTIAEQRRRWASATGSTDKALLPC
jgi:hypothetical protein